jgi:hypothetical protein
MKHHVRNRGIISVLAVLMLAILFTLAISIAGVSNQNELQAANQSRAEAARVQAEGGLSFLLQKLSNIALPHGACGGDVLSAVQSFLAARLNGTPNLGGASVTSAGGVVCVPQIVTDAARGRGFSASLWMDSNTVMRLRVTGASGGVTRTVQVRFNAVTGRSAVFDYGVAARGPIQMKGSAALLGVNSNDEADLFTAAYVDVAVALMGCAVIEGDLSLSDPGGEVSLSSNAMVGGEWGDDRWDHVHTGVGNVEFPDIDPGVFEPYATMIVDSHNAGLLTNPVKNIRIKAGTNPTFNNDMVLQGVVFVETPNNVTFNGHASITGVIVTQDAGHDNTANNSIRFNGTSDANGVENLPDAPEFAAIKAMPGSFLLAPGFEVELGGDFGVAAGCMAAESFRFSGHASGTVRGSIISYGETTFMETGSAVINIDRQNAPSQPPGFSTRGRLVLDMDSYGE